MIRSEENQLKKTLKRILKEKNISYAELAERIQVSVPTVARILTSEKLSIDRLLAVCDALDISFTSLVHLAGLEKQKEANLFTSEQEEFLAHNPHFMTYLRLLARGMSPSEIASEHKLTPVSSRKYLVELEAGGFISVRGSQIRLLCKWPPNWRFPGALQQKYFGKCVNLLCTHLTKETLERPDQYGKDFFFFLSSLLLSPKHYSDYIEELRALLAKFQTIADIDRHGGKTEDLILSSSILGVGKFDPIAASMGEIKNF